MKKRLAVIALIFVASTSLVSAQDWNRVHREDEAKWARRSGLAPSTVHSLWRMAASFADEKDDDSRIMELDVHSLAARRQVLLVTSAGEPKCLTVSVFTTVGNHTYRKLWAEQQTPAGKGFCDTPFGDAEVSVFEGAISISLPYAKEEHHPELTAVVVYQYEWKKDSYVCVGEKRMTRSRMAGE